MQSKKSPTLITHFRPHLDDTAAIWLLKKYHPNFKRSRVRFVPLRNATLPSDNQHIYIGMGRGRFDEHKSNTKQTAATLVWQEIKRSGYAPRSKEEQKGVEKILEYIHAEDKGLLREQPLRDFTIEAISYEGINEMSGSDMAISRHMQAFSAEALEVLLHMQRRRVRLEREIARGKRFNTPWGPGVGVYTSELHGTDDIAFQNGFVLVALIGKESGYRQIRANPTSKVDLTKAYQRAIAQEPAASWYLHQAKKLLLCGAPHGMQLQLSRLTLAQLIALVKK